MTNKLLCRSDLQMDNLIYLKSRVMFCDAWDIMFFSDLYFMILILSNEDIIILGSIIYVMSTFLTTEKIYRIDNKQYVQKTLP